MNEPVGVLGRLSYSDINSNNSIEANEILSEVDYYPFGLQHAENSIAITANKAAEKYQYNAKEFQDELNLNVFDYGARNYDAAIGRWFNVDPLAEDFPNFTSYHYVHNNPINLIDPTGMSVDGWIEEEKEGKKTLTHVDGIETVQQAKDAGFKNAIKVHNDDTFTIGEPNDYIFNADGTVGGLELRPSSRYDGMYYGYTDGGTEVRTHTFQEGINFRQSGAITPLGGTGDLFGLKEMFFGEVASATGSPLVGVALSAAAGKVSASSAVKSGGKGVNKITDSYLNKSGIDAHKLKREHLGNKAPIARYDLYKDKGGEVLILQKGGKGTPIRTGEFIK